MTYLKNRFDEQQGVIRMATRFRFSITLLLLVLVLGQTSILPLAGAQMKNSALSLSAEEQAELADLESKDAEDLLGISVSIATRGRTKLTAKEAPATVIVVTAEDIKLNHCRDLFDVFNMLPGYNIDVEDFTNEISVSARGLYAYLGRILYMVDGIPISGLQWGSYGAIGNDFPIHMIDRIEITRSPGFMLFGGVSELGVVNIITKNGTQLSGGQIRGRYGYLARFEGSDAKYGHQDLGVTAGQKIGRLEYSLLAFTGEGMRSSGDDTLGVYRQPFPQRIDSAYVNDTDFAFKGNYNRDTNFSAYYHQYRWKTLYYQLTYDPAVDDLAAVRAASSFQMAYIDKGASLSHHMDLGGNFHITPGLTYRYSNDDFSPGDATLPEIYSEEIKTTLLTHYLPGNFEFMVGGEFTQEHDWAWASPIYTTPYGFRKTINDPLSPEIWVNSYAGFLSAALKLHPIYMFAGMRYEMNDFAGDILVPRAGVTFVKDKFHAKLLYSQTYRAPTVMNAASSLYGLDPTKPNRPTKLTPERGQVLELENGYEFTNDLSATVNLFYQKLSNTLQFTAVSGVDYFTSNGPEIGSWGSEAEVKYHSQKYKGWFNVSYNKLAEAGTTPGSTGYLTPPNQDSMLGQPDYKFFTSHSYSITRKISVQASALFLTKKLAEFVRDPNDPVDPQYVSVLAPQLIVGMGMLWDEPIKNLNVGVSVHDLFDQKQRLAMAYTHGLHDPHQYKGTEVSVDLGYKF